MFLSGLPQKAATPTLKTSISSAREVQAFTMLEVLVSVAVVGIMFVSLYAGISAGFASVNLARENLRATQILDQKMEEFRTFTWYDLTTNATSIPTNFIAYFFPTNLAGSTAIDAGNSGTAYTGTVTIARPAISEGYSNDLRSVNLSVSWMSGKIQRTRSMDTMISRYGIRNYID